MGHSSNVVQSEKKLFVTVTEKSHYGLTHHTPTHLVCWNKSTMKTSTMYPSPLAGRVSTNDKINTDTSRQNLNTSEDLSRYDVQLHGYAGLGSGIAPRPGLC